MTEKEKAIELYKKYKEVIIKSDDRLNLFESEIHEYTKECTIICIDEILNLCKTMPDDIQIHYTNYWNKVKIEIQEL